ncbi:hypothetical protein ABFS83_05G109900 [Erythranthe nasuta]
MPATDNQGSFLNLISIRRNQLPSIETDQELEDLDLFQKHVGIRFSDILSSLSTTTATGSGDTPSSATADTDSPGAAAAPAIDKYIPPPPPPFLSINWFRTLLDTFLCCEAEFKAVLVSGRDPSQFSKPPLDRLIPDLLERAVKALDVCNAVSHGVELVRHWQKLGQIAAAALQQTPIGEGQVRRARKALATLLTSMALDDKENTAKSAAAKDRRGSFRSLSWSVAKSWSAAKQIQAMSTNLAAPRGAESTGLAMPIYIMSIILVFVMWALVAGVPCQERNGLATHLPVPKQLGWAQPMGGLLEKMGEEWKKKEKKGSGTGLLEEIQRMEKVAQSLIDFADSFVFPLEEEKAAEMAVQVAELAEICRKMEEGLAPLQQQVREVFHRMVRSRAEVLEVLEQVSKSSVPVPY